MPAAARRKRKREEMRKAEAASCRNLMTFFSRYIKYFTRRKIV
jgi:phosphatidylserine decarboxylase